MQSVVFQLGSVNVIIKEKGKTDDLRKLSTQNIIKIRFLLSKFVQAHKFVWNVIAVSFCLWQDQFKKV